MPPKKSKNSRKRNNRSSGTATMIRAPASAGSITRNEGPRIYSRGRSTFLQHTESFVSATQTNAFAFTRLDLVPASMPWLNGVAINFSKYRWHKLQLIYIPTCPTTNPGTVAFGLTFDDLDSLAGLNMGHVQQLFHSVACPTWAGFEGATMLHSEGYAPKPGAVYSTVDCDRFDQPWYKYATQLQIAALTAAETGRYVPASLIIGTDGGAAAPLIQVGRIYAKYLVELIEPIPPAIND
jgi:hypothetical protein